MKAWIVRDEYDEYSTVVFAETRNQARMEAQATDCCGDMAYLDIHPLRFKEADSMYRGKREMDWDDPEDRRFLVLYGWCCVYLEDGECKECCAADICDKYKDYSKEIEEEDEIDDARL